ncbi:histone cluster 1, H4d [Mycena galericulata]|nr:histone cluster 1, H4d [Mycena galericulata]
MARKSGEPRVTRGGKSHYPHLHARFRRIPRATILSITKPVIRRLARRGGVKRISRNIYDDMRGSLKIFLEGVVHDALLYMEHGYRTTITPLDITYALKRSGRTLYGFGL